MIGQFTVLCRVKELREQSKLRALRAKRAEVEHAVAAEARQAEVVQESARTLPEREDAVFAEILQSVVEVVDIDETKAKVLDLQDEHQRLADEAERLTQVRLRLEGELETARQAYQTAQRNLEKFTMIKSDLETEALRTAEALEETEIEELFSKGQALPI